ncbi:four-carbon acid sugar kinase family protein [Thalassospira profundimaris]|uniref:four-carbon acid sugar kinase family protein n=1 Tax=Thalassospira profundimaris TaxID=502049 RepID=UPI0015F0F0CF|nr:four-carbon acid sugar kinase family protein [Thalassospira profundimaris]
MRHPKLLIIADDLTGALDAASPFAMQGLRVQVALRPDALDQVLTQGADIVSVSTASRELPASDARGIIRRVLSAVPPETMVFKKIDSRLKGNIAAELSVFDFQRALVIPAIPAFERNVKNGAVVGFGVDAPIDIAAQLGDLAKRCLFPDISSDDEIDSIFARNHGADLFVGARGLAVALARKMARQRHGDEQLPQFVEPVTRMTFIVGSRDPITNAQVLELCAHRQDIAYMAAIDGVITSQGETAFPAWAPPMTEPAAMRLRLIQSLASESASKTALDAVRDIARHIAKDISCQNDGALFLTGGATAEAVLGEMGIAQFELLGDVIDGVPLARCENVLIITKSGGFGAPDALRQIAARMLGQREG